MKWEKGIFSYLIWLVYSLAIGGGLCCIVAYIGSEAGQPFYQTAFMSAGVLLLLGICVFLLNRLSKKMLLKENLKVRFSIWIELAAVVILLAVGVLIRLNHISMAQDPEDYFTMAKITAGGFLPQVVHGAKYLYLLLLHNLCFLFGNQMLVCIRAQMVVQLLASVGMYYGVRRLAGIAPALSLMAFTMLSGILTGEAMTLSPRPLYLLFYSIGLILVSESILKKPKSLVLGLLAGIYIGFLFYLDLLGITLLPVAFSVFYLWNERETEYLEEMVENTERTSEQLEEMMKIRQQKTSWVSRLPLLGVTLGGTVGGFLICVLFTALFSRCGWLSVLSAWGELYLPKGFSIPEQLQSIGNYKELLLLFLFLSMGIFSFFCQRDKEDISVFSLMGILIVVGCGFGLFTLQVPGYDLLYYLLTALGGSAIANILYDTDVIREEIVDKKIRQEQEAVLKQLEQTDSEQGLQYIENPLPLPKKHERKVLDYDYFVSDDDDYDVP